MKELKMFKNKDHYEIIIEDVFNIEKQLEWWRSSLKNDKC
jgi:hypothetical protein